MPRSGPHAGPRQVSVYQAGAASQTMLFSPWAANSSLGVPPGTAIGWASTAALLSVSEELRTSPASCCSSLAAGGRWCQDTNNTTPAVDSGARAACTAVHRCCAVCMAWSGRLAARGRSRTGFRWRRVTVSVSRASQAPARTRPPWALSRRRPLTSARAVSSPGLRRGTLASC